MESTSLDYIKDYNTFITFNIINILINKQHGFEFSICERNIYINKNKNILLDKDKLVVLENDSLPVSNDCRLGRYKLKNNWIELLDKDKLVV